MVGTALRRIRRSAPPLAAAFCTALAGVLASACARETAGNTARRTAGAGAAGAAGAASAGAGAGGHGGASGVVAHRRRITIAAGRAPVPADYSVLVLIDHASLVAEGKSLETGDDVKIMHAAGERLEELDRVVDPTSAWNQRTTALWFRTQAPIAASTSDDSYALVYGDDGEPGRSGPLSDPTRVFLFWDDFTGPQLASYWKYDSIGATTGWAGVADGVVRLSAQSGDVGDDSDSCAFLHVAVGGDFSAEALVTGYGGLLDSHAKVGGVMVRWSADAAAPNRLVSRLKEESRVSSWRLEGGGATSQSEVRVDAPFGNEWSRLDWIAGRTQGYASADGRRWDKIGPEVEMGPLTQELVLVGIPLATKQSGADGWVDVDWFRIRRIVAPEPAVTLADEEPFDRRRAP